MQIPPALESSEQLPRPSCRGVLAGLPHTTYRLPDRAPLGWSRYLTWKKWHVASLPNLPVRGTCPPCCGWVPRYSARQRAWNHIDRTWAGKGPKETQNQVRVTHVAAGRYKKLKVTKWGSWPYYSGRFLFLRTSQRASTGPCCVAPREKKRRRYRRDLWDRNRRVAGEAAKPCIEGNGFSHSGSEGQIF